MPSTTLPAAATGLPSSRRSILRGLAVLPAAVAMSSQATTAAPRTLVLAVMWRDVLTARTATEAASHAYKAAQDRMPWWAKPGPSHVNHKGEFSGPIVSSPAKQDHGLPREGAFRVIRVSAYDIDQRCRGLFEGSVSVADRDKRMAELNERIAAQKVEERKVGLATLEARWDAENEVLCNAEDAILALKPVTLDVIAAQILVTAVQDCCTTDTSAGSVGLGIAALALRGLLPHLTGELAEDAAEVVNLPDRPISAMRISTGYNAAGRKP